MLLHQGPSALHNLPEERCFKPSRTSLNHFWKHILINSLTQCCCLFSTVLFVVSTVAVAFIAFIPWMVFINIIDILLFAPFPPINVWLSVFIYLLCPDFVRFSKHLIISLFKMCSINEVIIIKWSFYVHTAEDVISSLFLGISISLLSSIKMCGCKESQNLPVWG